jgi:hypothetical protein
MMSIRAIVLFIFVLMAKAHAIAQDEPAVKELVVIGTMHFPIGDVNADSIFNAMEMVKPDLILVELDHSFFNEDYELIKTHSENENKAVANYKQKYPDVLIRPFEIEGRNKLRIERGIYPGRSDFFTMMQKLDSLGELSQPHSFIYNRFMDLSDSLAKKAYQSLYVLNDILTDNLAQERQFYQYIKIREVTDRQPLFATEKLEGSNGDSLTYREYYQRYSDFELLRESEMVSNILTWLQKTDCKRIVVLVGFYHRYALLYQLKYKQHKYNYVIREFFDYK